VTPQELNERFRSIHAGILAHYDGVSALLSEFNDLRSQPDEVWDAAMEIDTIGDKITDLEYDWENQDSA
jgi:uncharacterized coiled-coil DUF342 family protein